MQVLALWFLLFLHIMFDRLLGFLNLISNFLSSFSALSIFFPSSISINSNDFAARRLLYCFGSFIMSSNGYQKSQLVELELVQRLCNGMLMDEIIQRFFFELEGKKVTTVEMLFKESLGIAVRSGLQRYLLRKVCNEFYPKTDGFLLLNNFSLNFSGDEKGNEEGNGETVYLLKSSNIPLTELVMTRKNSDVGDSIFRSLDELAQMISNELNRLVQKHVIKCAKETYPSTTTPVNFTSKIELVASEDIGTNCEKKIVNDNLQRYSTRGEYEIVAQSPEAIMHCLRWDSSKTSALGFTPPLANCSSDMLAIGENRMKRCIETVCYWADFVHTDQVFNQEDILEMIYTLPNDFAERLYVNNPCKGPVVMSKFWSMLALSHQDRKKLMQLMRSVFCMENLVCLCNMGVQLPFTFLRVHSQIPTVEYDVVDMRIPSKETNKILIDQFNVSLITKEQKQLGFSFDSTFRFQVDEQDVCFHKSLSSFDVDLENVFEVSIQKTADLRESNTGMFYMMLPSTFRYERGTIDIAAKTGPVTQPFAFYQNLFTQNNNNFRDMQTEHFGLSGWNSLCKHTT